MPAEQPDLKAVLFDLDDTLNDRTRSWMAFVERMADPRAGHLGACVVADIHRSILAADEGGYRDKNALFTEMSRLPWKRPKSTGDVEKLWREYFPRCTVTRPGVSAVLGRLRTLGIRTAIVTNGRADAQQAKLKAMGMCEAVDLIITSGGMGCKKPDPRIYNAALSELGVVASEALFVGDNPKSDVVGPANLGLQTAWMANGREWMLPDVRPDHILEAFAELVPALSKLIRRFGD